MNAMTKPKVEALAEEIEALRARVESAMGNRAAPALTDALSRAREAAMGVAASTREVADTVAASTREMAEKVSTVTQREAEAAAGQVRAHPFLSVAIAAGIGALAGLAIGASSRRD